ncbi:Transferase [Trema orientale]|uniref:Transferase n=1 Tax=Trema orientale TaxID=63057 RepID=A0A2P5F461_TREOI|nr:Transferase [Trema orientale]
MAVRFKFSSMVKPAEPTWDGWLPLSEFAHSGSITHPGVARGAPPSKWLSQNESTVSNILVKSLSRALVTLFPLAGRLRWIGGGENHLELDCNGMGARFIEAESELRLDDFGSLLLSEPDYYSHLFPKIDYSLPLNDIPVMLVQLTRFSRGGFSLGLTKVLEAGEVPASVPLAAILGLRKDNVEKPKKMSNYGRNGDRLYVHAQNRFEALGGTLLDTPAIFIR